MEQRWESTDLSVIVLYKQARKSSVTQKKEKWEFVKFLKSYFEKTFKNNNFALFINFDDIWYIFIEMLLYFFIWNTFIF